MGVGQTELDIARTADTSLVVLVPESGDSIQTLKAGLMEIADIFAVNKADRPGADRLRNELELMLGLRDGSTLKNVPAHHGVDLSRPMTTRRAARDESGRAARAAAKDENRGPLDAARAAHRCSQRARGSTRSLPLSTGTFGYLEDERHARPAAACAVARARRGRR